MRKYSLVGVIAAVFLLIAGCGGGGGGSSTIDVSSLKIAPSPAAAFVDDTITFTASGGSSPYSWTSGNTGLIVFVPEQSSSNGATAVFKAIGTGSATVFVLDKSGKGVQATVTITRRTPRTVPQTAAMQFSGGDTPSTLTLRVSGGFPPYSWSVDNPSVAFISSESVNVDTVTITARGIGSTRVFVFDDSNASSYSTVTITASHPRISPSQAVIGLGESLDMVGFQGAAPYVWELSDQTLGSLSAVTSTEGQTVTFDASTTEEGTTYVTITDSAGLQERALVEVKRLTPVTPSIIPSQAYLLGGQTLTLRVEGGTLPFVWTNDSPDLGTIVPTTQRTADFTAFGTASGTATVTAQDNTGHAATASVIITQFLDLLPSTVTASRGDSVTFTIAGGTAPFQALLNVSQGGTVSVSGNQVTVAIASSASASLPSSLVLQVIDANGAIATATIQVTVGAS